MSFVASLCLSYTGSTPLGGVMNIYSNLDLVNPVVSSVSLSDITFPNCPYDVTVPDSTTSIRILDISTRCYVDIPVQSNDLCVTCNLNFDSYSATSVGSITAGIITGDCQSNISDYYINWYGPNNLVDIAFTSGSGSTFSYQYQQPLSGATSIPVAAGTYTPIIQEIIISGITFSITGGTPGSGQILANLDCLPIITVDSYRCDNQTNTNFNYPYSAYSHYISFDISSQLPPQAVTTTFEISAGTKFIAWQFEGQSVPDRILLTLSGANYPIEIGLEDFVVGSNLAFSDLSPSLFPKSASTATFLPKITTLTGLTISDGDKILISVNPATSNTNWKLYFTCLTDYSCQDCIRDSQYKIIGSTLTPTLGSCSTTNIGIKISGCTYSDFFNSDFSTFYSNENRYGFNWYSYFIWPDENTNEIYTYNSNMYFSNVSCENTYVFFNSTCQLDSSATTYKKTFLLDGTGVFSVTGSSSVVSQLYNGWNYLFTNYSGSTNSLDLSYYRFFRLKIPSETSPDNCGDSNAYRLFYFNVHSPIETGTTGSYFFFTITASTMVDSSSSLFTSCDLNCVTSAGAIVSSVNATSTGYTYPEKTFSSGLHFDTPFEYVSWTISSTTSLTEYVIYGTYETSDWETNTYPFSGSPATLIPSLSGSCCPNYAQTGSRYSFLGTYFNNNYAYYFKVRLTNPLNNADFDISANTISNRVTTGTYVLAYRYSGGSVLYSDPTYII